MRPARSETSSGGGWPRLSLIACGLGALLALVSLQFFVRGSALHGDLSRSATSTLGLWPFTYASTAHHVLLALLFLVIVGLVWTSGFGVATLAALCALAISVLCMGDSWGHPTMRCGFANSCSEAELMGSSEISVTALLDFACFVLALLTLSWCGISWSNARRRNETRAVRRVSWVLLILAVGSVVLCLGVAEGTARQAEAELPAPTSTPRVMTPTPIPVTPGPAGLRDPEGITVDARGVVWIVEPGPGRVIGLAPGGGTVASWSLSQHVAGAWDIAAGPGGSIFVSDVRRNRVQEFSRTGAPRGAWGTSHGDSHLSRPRGIADSEDGLFVADRGNDRMVEFTAPKQWHFSSPGPAIDVAVGPSPLQSFTIYGGTRIERTDTFGSWAKHWGRLGSAPGQLRDARGIAVSRNGTVYVADTGNNRIQVFSLRGQLRAVWSQGWLRPYDVAVGRHGEIYVADTGHERVVALTPNGHLVRQWR